LEGDFTITVVLHIHVSRLTIETQKFSSFFVLFCFALLCFAFRRHKIQTNQNYNLFLSLSIHSSLQSSRNEETLQESPEEKKKENYLEEEHHCIEGAKNTSSHVH
jgi:hypothetical protein